MSKPTYYTFGMSVWAAAGELAIADLEYPADAIDVKVVNLAEGANFTPEFLAINPNGTLPTLVADGKAYTSTKQVIKYLIEHAPRKAAKGTALRDTLQEAQLDPNAPMLLARNDEQLKALASGFPLIFLQNRQDSLEKHSALPAAADFQEFYTGKKAVNGGLLAVFKGAAPDAAKAGTITAFIMTELPTLLPESGFLGGETPGEDDYHLGAWLARIAMFTGGSVADGGPVPPKVEAYWKAWAARPAFQKVYEKGLH
ncbi:uncharacterized protein BXZ73DRAFT_87343 [Epithele typhae]|uniref:uncharacterized protein n=1 Tax=Epithele typhae TaxID=378194 RepID=UPI0020077894|nr:uncharacterized protein BXZ73DRAFT_87343 [Epithele typhae]KAH9944447.1 hypothetical protein BXZ73DRAFT_87343 [Epithele typhae]